MQNRGAVSSDNDRVLTKSNQANVVMLVRRHVLLTAPEIRQNLGFADVFSLPESLVLFHLSVCNDAAVTIRIAIQNVFMFLEQDFGLIEIV